MVRTPLGGSLFSSGPTCTFFGDIEMNFISPVTFVATEIIGSGLNISAELEAFDVKGQSLGTAFHTYYGNTGQLSLFGFSAPPGELIQSVIFNGGLNSSNSLASIGTLIFQPVPEPSTLLLLGSGLLGLIGFRRRFRK